MTNFYPFIRELEKKKEEFCPEPLFIELEPPPAKEEKKEDNKEERVIIIQIL